jgi:4'-phosphopantetheinyl transferase
MDDTDRAEPTAGPAFEWIVLPAGEEPAGRALLTQRERCLYQALRFPRRRHKWLLGRIAVKKLLGPLLSVDDTAITTLNEPSGAPFVEIDGVGRLDWAISISHRAAWGAAAVARPPVRALGIDIETVEPRSDAWLADYFTSREMQDVAAAGPKRDQLVALTWSAKESMLKALGVGLRLDTRTIEVRAPSVIAQAWAPLSLSLSGEARADGIVSGYCRAGPGYVLTAVVVS